LGQTKQFEEMRSIFEGAYGRIRPKDPGIFIYKNSPSGSSGCLDAADGYGSKPIKAMLPGGKTSSMMGDLFLSRCVFGISTEAGAGEILIARACQIESRHPRQIFPSHIVAVTVQV
jgi:hypothetical protein